MALRLRLVFLVAIFATGFVYPSFAEAQTIEHIITVAGQIVELIIPLLMTIAVAVFFYGVVKYIAASGDQEKIKEAKGYLIYGVVGLFAVVAFWGLVTVFTSTFGLDVEDTGWHWPDAPYL